MTITFTDALGNPIHVGDIIAVPAVSGSRAQFYTTTVEVINEIIPFDSNDPYCRTGFFYQDRHLPVPERVVRYIPADYDYANRKWLPDLSKAYQLKVRRSADDVKTATIRIVDRIIVVTSLVTA